MRPEEASSAVPRLGVALPTCGSGQGAPASLKPYGRVAGALAETRHRESRCLEPRHACNWHEVVSSSPELVEIVEYSIPGASVLSGVFLELLNKFHVNCLFARRSLSDDGQVAKRIEVQKRFQ